MERQVQAQAPGSTRLHLVRRSIVASGSIVPIWREQVSGKPHDHHGYSCTVWLGESEMIQILFARFSQSAQSHSSFGIRP
jgi:hypothetical protein